MSLVVSLAEVLPSESIHGPGDGDRWPWAVAAPLAVVRPSSTEEVAATMRWATRNRVGVVVMASGRRFRGAERMDRPFVVLVTDRLVGTEVYEPADLTITAKAGTRLSVLSAELAAHHQWLPYDPPHRNDRTLGGLVATGESGSLWMGYGDLRNHVLGATLVTGDARVVRLGGRVVKNVAGFDILKVVVGSRGTLGVVTSLCVRTFPAPPSDRLLVLGGDSVAALLGVARAVGTAPILPVSCVVVAPAVPLAAPAALLVRLHGAEPTVEADHKTLERHCGVVFEAARPADAVLGYARDHAVEGGLVLAVSVVPSRLPEALAAVREALGGSGDHPVALDTYRGSLRVAAGVADAPAVARLTARVEALGGVVTVRSARPGLETDAMGSQPSRAATALTGRLESVFDPQSVLWSCRQ